MENVEYPFTTFNFLVYLTLDDPSALGLSNPLCSSEFAECDGLEMTMEPKTIREGGNNTQQIHLAGPVSYGNLTLKRGMTSNQDLWTWFNAAVGNPSGPVRLDPNNPDKILRGELAGAEIIMRDASGIGQVRYRLFDCLPIKLKAAPLNAKEGIIAMEEMQIAYSYFTIETV
jgi:phage tail-like protein